MISSILCGGSGSRLWPLSREASPKPFLILPDGQPLIQKSFFYASELSNIREIITVTRKELYFKIIDEIKNLNIKNKVRYMLEPMGRNTAPAIAAVALLVKELYGPYENILVLAADHLISNKEEFITAVKKADELASEGFLVTFGIKPSCPNTGFGYIEADGHQVKQFVEKPNVEKAKEYLMKGNFYWNAGMFCFKAQSMIEELERFAPELLNIVKECLNKSDFGGHTEKIELNADIFAKIPDISIDYAVMEKSDRVAVVPCDMGWSDLGSWNDLCGLSEADENKNHINNIENIISIDTKNCNVHTDERLLATIGLNNLLIVDTKDAILIADKSRVQEVKEVYNQLKEKQHESYKLHRTVHRPWGSYTVLETGARFQIKRLEIKPGASLSLQLHYHRNEHWIVVGGMAEVTCDDKIFLVGTNESTYIKAGHKHRVANRGLMPLVIIEVQSGDYLSEDDIVRFEDIYGRTENI